MWLMSLRLSLRNGSLFFGDQFSFACTYSRYSFFFLIAFLLSQELRIPID